MTAQAPARIPVVDYLVLDPEPHLVAQECTECSARYFDRRDGCAGCFGTDFAPVTVPNSGEVVSFTIVAHARPGVKTPYIAAIIDCGGTWVRANIDGLAPDPAVVSLRMPVHLVTYSLGADSAGTDAVGFGYRPDSPEGEQA
jgi:uncharacterized OB-fold protein